LAQGPLSLDNIPESRVTLARTPAGQIEYRRIPSRLVPYFHEKAHEFSYVLQGRAAGFIKNESIQTVPGHLLIVPQRTALGLRTASEEPLELLSFYAPAPDGLDEVQVLIGDAFPPGDPSSLRPQPLPMDESDVSPGMLDLTDWSEKELAKQGSGWEWAYLAQSSSGSVALVRVTGHLQLKKRSVHFLYIRQGQARITVDEKILEAMAGQLVILPNTSVRTIERLGADRLEFLLFSAPTLREKDVTER
jgi:mannose-6-phosphate isomerase-like protein (cupin superfamily)